MTSRIGRFFACLALAAATALLASCSLVALHRDLRTAATAGVVKGEVIHEEADAPDIIVFALRDEGDRWVVDNYVHLATREHFLMRLVAGERYRIGAFVDRNGNLRPDADEPGVLEPETVTIAQGWKGASLVSLRLSPTSRLAPEVAAAAQHVGQIERQPLPVWVGEVADLDDERLSADGGRLGFWQPFEFLVNVGIGVFFLEPYDAQRMPVLFISGAGGHPGAWWPMVDALDRSRFQPWFFVYPSGQRLASSAEALNRTVAALQRQYGVDRLCVVAYSMGGLVARDFIRRNAGTPDSPALPVFISIATPWQGHRAARLGVERSPAVIPSWIDMQTDSDFQQSIFARPLPPSTGYYLFFAQTDPAQPIERANDGTVSVVSQLHPDAVRDAREVLGFTENHTSVLRSPDVIAAYLRILATPLGATGK